MRRNGANGREVACGLLVMVCVLVMMGRGWAQGSEPTQNPGQNPTQNSGQAPGRELPDAPGVSQKKDQSENPVQFVEHKTKRELLRARDWESSEPTQNPGQNPTQNSGQAPGRELPDAPGVSQKKDQSENPVHQEVL